MQFSIVAIVVAATFAAANPTSMMAKRTCGTLSGKALTICQTACKIACTAATAGFAQVLCDSACEAGPLRVRSSEENEDSVLTIDARSAEPEAEADLVARMAAAEADPEAHVNELVSRITGQQVCNIACDIACNSTILALAQTKCLQICKGKCA